MQSDSLKMVERRGKLVRFSFRRGCDLELLLICMNYMDSRRYVGNATGKYSWASHHARKHNAQYVDNDHCGWCRDLIIC